MQCIPKARAKVRARASKALATRAASSDTRPGPSRKAKEKVKERRAKEKVKEKDSKVIVTTAESSDTLQTIARRPREKVKEEDGVKDGTTEKPLEVYKHWMARTTAPTIGRGQKNKEKQ